VGFIILFAVGGVLAWVASILTRGDDGKSIALYLIAGLAGALVFGGLASRESLMIGLSAKGLIAGLTGAVALLAALAWARTRVVH